MIPFAMERCPPPNPQIFHDGSYDFSRGLLWRKVGPKPGIDPGE